MRLIGLAVVLAGSLVLVPIAARSQTARTYRVAMLEPTPTSVRVGALHRMDHNAATSLSSRQPPALPHPRQLHDEISPSSGSGARCSGRLSSLGG